MPGARMRRRKQARDARRQQDLEGGGEDENKVGLSGKVSLFDDDDDAHVELKVNEKFKKRFEHNEGLKDKMRLKELQHELGDGDESSESEEDEDADLLTSKINDGETNLFSCPCVRAFVPTCLGRNRSRKLARSTARQRVWLAVCVRCSARRETY